jgi:PhnO protein
MITIRRATSGDADCVYKLVGMIDSSYINSIDHFRQAYYKNLENPELIYLVAEINGSVAAFSSLSFITPLHRNKQVAEIHEIIVDECGRGKSLGAQLLNAMMLLARDRNCCCLEVTCPRSSKRTHRFFAKHGMQLSRYLFSMNIEFKVD